MNTIETLNAISHCYENCSDYRIAKMMGVTRQLVSLWRIKRNTMSDEQRIKAAELLNQDPALHLVYGRLERSKTSQATTVWKSAVEKISAASLCLILTFSFLTPASIEASTANAVYYVK